MKPRKIILGKSGGVGLRKIFRVGRSSPAVCIPKDFLREHGIRLGGEVVLVWNNHIEAFPTREKVTGYGKKVHARVKQKFRLGRNRPTKGD